MNTHEPFVIEQTYNAPVEKVWKAISDREQMKQWYFDVPAFKPETGTEFQFTAGPDGRSFVHLCKVTKVVPNKLIQYSWKYQGYEGNSLVTWELFDEGDKTRLRLTHEGLETFPDNPDFARKNFEGGWSSFVNKRLPDFLEKVSV